VEIGGAAYTRAARARRLSRRGCVILKGLHQKLTGEFNFGQDGFYIIATLDVVVRGETRLIRLLHCGLHVFHSYFTSRAYKKFNFYSKDGVMLRTRYY
jgi:hypothetical protein